MIIVKLTFILSLNYTSNYITCYICVVINHKCKSKVMYGNHFKFHELVVTSSALDNTVTTPAHLGNLANLWDHLNFLREKFGKPIYINSAYRTPSVNKQVGGAKRSLHMQGRAADIRPKDLQELEQLWNIVCSYDKEYGCLSEKIKYATFIHIAI